jgi:membrane protein DedA with SNARE-associated domain
MNMPLLAVNLVSHLTYLGVFIGTFLEGPMVGLLTGFLVKAGFLNFPLAYAAHVFGDLTADFFYYFIGYQGREKLVKKLGVSEKNLTRAERIRRLFRERPQRIIVLGKLTHVVGLPVLLGIGMSHYPWPKFLLFDFLATIIKSAVLIFLGYYLAEFWTKASDLISYLNWLGMLVIIIIVGYLAMREATKKLWRS